MKQVSVFDSAALNTIANSVKPPSDLIFALREMAGRRSAAYL